MMQLSLKNLDISPLSKAVSNGHVNAVILLVDNGAILSDNLLPFAANDIRMLKLLIDDYGLNKNKYSVFIVDAALALRNLTVLRYIRPSYDDLYISHETIDLILNMGIDINERFGHDGDTLLHMCIRAGMISLARYLIKNKEADASICNDIGEKPTLSLRRMWSV
jgi:ankyrin repeat protein